ncbi:hypothetical protein [Streptomyces spiramenti]|uniref:Uncharacterized protein n=1 Tax=Streptomyces spiramenti TaxID=2720606 RepID=A0ABX1AIE0_9ACTN|nr:hypothetical protein [Streptomyces spiramenti]NJP66923.1 hypothetical protein [Streptomyces spiramenti]
MSADESRYVRLHVELVLEVADSERLTSVARQRVDADELMPDAERLAARDAVAGEPAEAVAYLVEPAALIGDLPGVELVHASWSSEPTEADGEPSADPDADWYR